MMPQTEKEWIRLIAEIGAPIEALLAVEKTYPVLSETLRKEFENVIIKVRALIHEYVEKQKFKSSS